MINSAARGRSIEILLVEDNPGDVRLTKEGLTESKVRNNLHVVSDGVEAMAFLRREGPHAGAVRPEVLEAQKLSMFHTIALMIILTALMAVAGAGSCLARNASIPATLAMARSSFQPEVSMTKRQGELAGSAAVAARQLSRRIA